MSTEEPVDEGEPITNGRVSQSNSLLTILTGFITIAAGLGLEAGSVNPSLMPLSFVWCFVFALRIADTYVRHN